MLALKVLRTYYNCHLAQIDEARVDGFDLGLHFVEVRLPIHDEVFDRSQARLDHFHVTLKLLELF